MQFLKINISLAYLAFIVAMPSSQCICLFMYSLYRYLYLYTSLLQTVKSVLDSGFACVEIKNCCSPSALEPVLESF